MYPLCATVANAVAVSVITPPTVSSSILAEAIALGVRDIWFQPGSEPESLEEVNADLQVLGDDLNVISGGACLLVEFGFDESTN
jgi:predicted CoA-binding protein